MNMTPDADEAVRAAWPQIAARVVTRGIPGYVARWPHARGRPSSMRQARAWLRAYHCHTSVRYAPTDQRAKGQVRGRPTAALRRIQERYVRPPVVTFDDASGIGTLKCFTCVNFILTQDEFERAQDRIVATIRGALDDWERRGLRGLVLDFRKHHGGSFYPMLRGFARYLVGVPLFAWVSKEAPGPREKAWVTLRREDDRFGTNTAYRPRPEGLRLARDMRIAVIVGPMTASSGEIAAAMFAGGKEGVRIFGRPTAGLLTPNEEMRVGDFWLTLTVCLTVLTDGSMNPRERLEPDQPCGADVLRVARRWLGKKE